MSTYNWQLPDWPNFEYTLEGLYEPLQAIALKIGSIEGKIAHLSPTEQMNTLLEVLIEEAIKTSEIEGEFISRQDIRSSLKNRLSLGSKKRSVPDKRAEGVVNMMLSMRDNFDKPLSADMLCEWHMMLMSASFQPNLTIGQWRCGQDPMQIVSSRSGRWGVHYEAPPSAKVPQEMETFLKWFNQSAPTGKAAIAFAPIRSAIAHLYFESIHPFDDGDGRIGRAIAEKVLAQGFGYPILISLSHAIDGNKKAYYQALQVASHSNEITPWLKYFVELILQAQTSIEDQVNFVISKAKFFNQYEDSLNPRELKVVRRMLAEGVKGFEGGMSAKKYAKIVEVSKATATRDLQHLSSIGAFLKFGEGRTTHYELNLNS